VGIVTPKRALGFGIVVVLALPFALSRMGTASPSDTGAPAGPPEPPGTRSSDGLVGLWEAKRRFGPDVRGTLFLRRDAAEWRAEIAGRVVGAEVEGDSIVFALPGGQGDFRGELEPGGGRIVGHWIQGRTVESGLRYASPVTLARHAEGEWRGEVVPIDDAHTFYLMVTARPDGSLGAFLRNPERNLGWFQLRADRIEQRGDVVRLLGAADGPGGGRVLAEGRRHADPERLSIHIPNRGGTFDFERVPEGEPSGFAPRGRPAATYRYAPPPALDDGWETATLEDVGISRTKIEAFIRTILETPITSANSQEDHGILVARHGKLVLEEYFHGEHREKPHDTRSASKSVASDLLGAAIHAGVPVTPATRVYEAMNGGAFPPGLEPRRRALTVEHLLTMTSGLDCDDNDESSPGYEDRMWEQTSHPDFYTWTMDLRMVRDPGREAVYCSANPNLVGGLLQRVSGTPLPGLFHELIAVPLQIGRYYLPLSPSGDYTMTGGARFLPRDFMKLGQLHLNGGTWGGRRIFSEEWSRHAVERLVDFPSYELGYGYLWWVVDYPYRGRTVRGHFASGNGGQVVMAIPELDLVLAFYAGNYNDAGGRVSRKVYVPEFILPAVDE
jgi:CubicO group peptidase (beta-lactamase class C family)